VSEVRAVIFSETGTHSLTALEQARADSLKAATARLEAISEALDEEGPMIEGSRGQRRAHGLLQRELELRRYIDETLRVLVADVQARVDGVARAERWASDAELSALLDSVS
jgi:hypothetical protein